MGENSIVETLKTIKALTSQQLTLSNKIMALKRQLAGKSANKIYIDDMVAVTGDKTPTSTSKAKPESNLNEPKRGRGRPKKNTTVTSIISETRHMPTPMMHPMTPQPKDTIDADGVGIEHDHANAQFVKIDKKKVPISIYGYNNICTDTGRIERLNLNPVYVIEDDDLFIRDDNGMLYDIDSCDVIGWYNPYASGCSINWLYR